MKIYKLFFILCLFLLFFTPHIQADIPQEFRQKLANLKWIAYAPTHFNPEQNIYPSEESIRADLKTLYQYGFNGIVTYGSDNSLAKIPQIACEEGFQGLIMGIWDIESNEEIQNAISAAEYVDGYCVGNEGLNSRYDLLALQRVILALKDLTQKPVTTTEQAFDYSHDGLFSTGDWIFPNIHPFLAEIKDPKKAVSWIKKHYQLLNKHCPGNKVVLFKEVGYPTAGMPPASEKIQAEFFKELEKNGTLFVYFEAFDQLWKNGNPVEPHWGLFKSNRQPKRYIREHKLPLP